MATISRLPVCDLCLARIEPIHSEICGICGERLPGARFTGEYVCGDCRREQPLFARATAYGSYEGGLRDLIHLFKYEQVRPAGWVLGRMLGEVIQELAAEFDTAVVVPVPLHKARLRQRHQAEEIARHALQSMRCDRLEVAGVLKRRRARNHKPDSPSRSGAKTFAVLLSSNIRRRSLPAPSCWSMTCLPPGQRFPSVPGCCAGRGQRRFLSQRSHAS